MMTRSSRSGTAKPKVDFKKALSFLYIASQTAFALIDAPAM